MLRGDSTSRGEFHIKMGGFHMRGGIPHQRGDSTHEHNLDLMVKVKHMGSTNQNNSIHWFNLNAVQIRVIGNHLDNTRPTKPVLEMENVDFLPSPADNQNYLHDITAIATRVVIKHIPAFNIFKDVTVHHIPHKYSEDMKQKSQQVKLSCD